MALQFAWTHTKASPGTYLFFSQFAEANIITLVSTAMQQATVKLTV